MKDRSLSWRLLLTVGSAAFFVFLLAFLPARVMLPRVAPDARYSDAQGSIWQAAVRDLSLGTYHLGNTGINVSPLSLVSGGLAADISFDGPNGRGSVTWRRDGGTHLEGLSLIRDVQARIGGRVLSGAVSVSGSQFSFDEKGQCQHAEGMLRSNILEALGPIDGPPISGGFACKDGLVTVRFTGEHQAFSISGQGPLNGMSGAPLELVLTSKTTADLPEPLILMLRSAGLRQTDEGWRGQLILDLS